MGEEAATRVEEGSIARRIGLLCLGCFGIVSLMRKRRERIRITGYLSWLILFFLTWAVFSLAWADDIALTFRRLVVLAMLCIGALAVSKSFSLQQIIWFTFFSTGMYLIIGLSAELALGTFHPLASDYRFAGMIHPNTQGTNCALLLVAAVALSENRKRARAFFFAIALIALVFLILTKSRTSFATAILALFTYWSFVSSGLRKLASALCMSISFCLLLLLFGDIFFPTLRHGILLGRESPSTYTLTGRIPLWNHCLDYIAIRPLQGYGYEGFWTPRHITKISAIHEWETAIAHSAYLDLLLGLGLVGMVTYFLILITGLRRSFVYYKAYQNIHYVFIGVLLIFCLLHGLLESGVISRAFLGFLQMTVLAKLGFQCHYTRHSQTGE